MMKPLFYIEANQCRTTCKQCSGIIEEEALVTRTQNSDKFYYFHLNCYTPEVKRYISKADIDAWYLDSEKERILNSWLSEWNKNWTSPDTIEDYTSDNKAPDNEAQTVNLKLYTNRRAWLEILKFIDPMEVLKSISRVNKILYQISCNEELWKFYCLKSFENIKLDDDMLYKEKYSFIIAKYCIWFHKITDKNHPLISVCKRCGISEINPHSLKLKFNMWDYLSKKRYKNKFNKAIEEFNIKKRNLIFEMQESHVDLRLIRFAENIGIRGKCEEFIDLNSISVKNLPDLTNINMSITVWGKKNTGCYSLMKQYFEKTFGTPKSDYIRIWNYSNTKKVKKDNKELNIKFQGIDWAWYKSTKTPLEKISCCILLYDIAEWYSFAYLEELKRYTLQVLQKKPYENFPFVVIGNKVDKERERIVPYETASEWCRQNGNILFYETSAKDNINVDIAFEMAILKGVEWETKRLVELELNKTHKKSKNRI